MPSKDFSFARSYRQAVRGGETRPFREWLRSQVEAISLPEAEVEATRESGSNRFSFARSYRQAVRAGETQPFREWLRIQHSTKDPEEAIAAPVVDWDEEVKEAAAAHSPTPARSLPSNTKRACLVAKAAEEDRRWQWPRWLPTLLRRIRHLLG